MYISQFLYYYKATLYPFSSLLGSILSEDCGAKLHEY